MLFCAAHLATEHSETSFFERSPDWAGRATPQGRLLPSRSPGQVAQHLPAHTLSCDSFSWTSHRIPGVPRKSSVLCDFQKVGFFLALIYTPSHEDRTSFLTLGLITRTSCSGPTVSQFAVTEQLLWLRSQAEHQRDMKGM